VLKVLSSVTLVTTPPLHRASTTDTFVSVTPPVLVTVNVYVIVSPT
jgi:hypothetical protein